MPKITKLQPQVKRDGYYNIFVDDAFFCSISELQLSLLSLSVGQDLSEDQKLELLDNSATIKTYNRALYYLKYGPRSEKQMKNYLSQKGYEDKYIDRAITTLIKDGYINDTVLAQSFVDDRQLFRPRSLSQLRVELIKKGIDRDIIDQTLMGIDSDSQLESIKAVAAKKYKQSRYKDLEKLTQYLQRQGFKYSDIKTALSEIGD